MKLKNIHVSLLALSLAGSFSLASLDNVCAAEDGQRGLFSTIKNKSAPYVISFLELENALKTEIRESGSLIVKTSHELLSEIFATYGEIVKDEKNAYRISDEKLRAALEEGANYKASFIIVKEDQAQ
ncbi:MAG TPA: hypothetical protein PLY23_08630 [Alphaproteobacteria bacterium]|nr:hypothetical protein [Alphaproteobacteria bacterium]HQS94704.1 hypothetical protein [Alphaproteobacteria bacterium]